MALVWLALAVGAVSVIASLVYVTLKGLEAFRAVRRLAREAGTELDAISAASAQIERHLALAAESGSRLEVSLARLRRSRAELTVLTTALADARAALNRLTGVVPQK